LNATEDLATLFHEVGIAIFLDEFGGAIGLPGIKVDNVYNLWIRHTPSFAEWID
jgi:hypothetical protein